MKQDQIIPQTDATSSRKSNTLDLGDLKDVSIQVTFTGSDLTGTLKLEASNNGTTFVDVAESTEAVTLSEDHIWNLAVANYRFLRADWVYTSGSGTIQMDSLIKANPITGA